MCCSSGRVVSVSGTRIFARPVAEGRQVLAYAMNVALESELAMCCRCRGDFGRIDARFRLPEQALSSYGDWGFCVFKLKPKRRWLFGGPGRQSIHPMAFEFPRRNVRQLFFPRCIFTTASCTRTPSSIMRCIARCRRSSLR